jgi:hypothetical protein
MGKGQAGRAEQKRGGERIGMKMKEKYNNDNDTDNNK